METAVLSSMFTARLDAPHPHSLTLPLLLHHHVQEGHRHAGHLPCLLPLQHDVVGHHELDARLRQHLAVELVRPQGQLLVVVHRDGGGSNLANLGLEIQNLEPLSDVEKILQIILNRLNVGLSSNPCTKDPRI